MYRLEREIVTTLPTVTTDLAHEFQGSKTSACQEPIPHIEANENNAKRAIKYRQEVHQMTMVAVVVVLPHAYN